MTEVESEERIGEKSSSIDVADPVSEGDTRKCQRENEMKDTEQQMAEPVDEKDLPGVKLDTESPKPRADDNQEQPCNKESPHKYPNEKPQVYIRYMLACCISKCLIFLTAAMHIHASLKTIKCRFTESKLPTQPLDLPISQFVDTRFTRC